MTEHYERPFLNPTQYTTQTIKNPYVTNYDIYNTVESQKNKLPASMYNESRYCDRETVLPLNETQKFKEAPLIGPANPDTNFNLYIEPRPADVLYWRENQFVNYDRLNKYKPTSLYDSGYIPREFKSKPLFDITQYSDDNNDNSFVIERNTNTAPYKKSFVKEVDEIDREFPMQIKENYSKEKTKSTKEDFSYSNNYEQYGMDMKKVPDFYYSCGINTDNPKFNLPINYPATPLELRDKQKNLNNDTFTLQLTPTLANQYEVIQPNNSNLSISTVLPKREQTLRVENGKSIYTSSPPLPNTENKLKNPFNGEIAIDAIYDSKSVGYGPSYRSYYEPVSGTMRYYYDDIDVVKTGAILASNKIDVFDGTMQRGIMPGPMYDLNEMRKIEQNRWLDLSAMHRESMQSSLMEYIGDKEWQTKVGPIYGSI
jgi:hypothetical protein